MTTMARDDHLLTASIDDYLLGLAGGLERAQRQLSQQSMMLQRGEAPLVYQIPRLDFELKLSLELREEDGRQLRFRPARVESKSQTRTAEMASLIRGSFVAVPANGGRPPPVVRTTLRRIGSHQLEYRVAVSSAAGERLPGVDVQFNVDRELSKTLNPLPNAEFKAGAFDDDTLSFDRASFDVQTELAEGTRFWDGLVTTDGEGIAVGVLDVDQREQGGSLIATVVDVLEQTETVLFKVD